MELKARDARTGRGDVAGNVERHLQAPFAPERHVRGVRAGELGARISRAGPPLIARFDPGTEHVAGADRICNHFGANRVRGLDAHAHVPPAPVIARGVPGAKVLPRAAIRAESSV